VVLANATLHHLGQFLYFNKERIGWFNRLSSWGFKNQFQKAANSLEKKKAVIMLRI
jgi:hypothetical protein